MTLVEQPGTPAALKAVNGKSRKSKNTVLVLLAAFVGFCLLRWATGASQFTSIGSVSSALELTMPIAMAGLAGLWSERAGVVNIGLEGMLIAGTIFGGWMGVTYGPWAGILAGLLGGAVFGLIHAIATVTFGVDHIVSGVAINILAVGVAGLIAEIVFPDSNGKQSPRVSSVPEITIPWESGLDTLQRKNIPVISDLAGILGGVTSGLSLLTLICALLFPLTFYLLWRTAFGLRIRSVGENPSAAESLGVNVYKMKYIAVIISGAIGGLGGAFLVVVSANGYLENQTGGRGYIGLAALIFGNWTVAGTALGSLLFGYATSVRLRGDDTAVTLVIVLIAVLLAVLVLREFKKIVDGEALKAPRARSSTVSAVMTVVLGIAALGVLVVAAFQLVPALQFVPREDVVQGAGAKIAIIVMLVALAALLLAVSWYSVKAFGVLRATGVFSPNLAAYTVGFLLFGWMWLGDVHVPGQFVTVIPNIVTLLVLAFAAQSLRPPAADGLIYRKGE